MSWTERFPPRVQERLEALLERELASYCAGRSVADETGRWRLEIDAAVHEVADDAGQTIAFEVCVGDLSPLTVSLDELLA
jgi:hypothetical protein